MPIEKIKELTYFYNFKEGNLPEITPENLKIVIDKVNEIIEYINKKENMEII